MKKLTLIPAFCFLLSAFPCAAWTITNILIGVDSNSNAWSKVNANNSQYVGWLNQMTSTNNLLAVQQAGIATQYGVITNSMGVFLASGRMSFDAGQITSDGSGDLTVAGSVSFAGGLITSDSVGNLTVGGGLTALGELFYVNDTYVSYGPEGEVNFMNGAALSGADLVDLGTDGAARFAGGALTIDDYGNLTASSATFDGGDITTDGVGDFTIMDSLRVDFGTVYTDGSGTGQLTANSFVAAGDGYFGAGSGLTGLLAAQLTGPVTNQLRNISGLITNGPCVWLSYRTNGMMGATLTNLPWGTICTTTNGQMFVLSNMVWLLK
jgi:hypothetical protein